MAKAVWGWPAEGMSLNAAGHPHAGFAAAEPACTKWKVEVQQCAEEGGDTDKRTNNEADTD